MNCTSHMESSLGRAAKRPATEPAASASYLLALPERIFNALFTWQERISQRHHLMSLDDRMLGDLGLSRADVAREMEKPFWTP